MAIMSWRTHSPPMPGTFPSWGRPPGLRPASPSAWSRLERLIFPGERSEVAGICGQIARDIRNQYTIGYVPTRPAQPGFYRSIRVNARNTAYGKLFLRTRSGYIAGGESRLVKDEGVK